MTADRFILVAYDISDDKRRTKLHNKLLDYGTPVQYSVFECLLSAANEHKMREAVKRIISPKKDHVRFYPLCKSCLARVETTGGREILDKLPNAVVVETPKT